MGRYNVTIRFSGGDEIRATVEAKYKHEALKKVESTEQYRTFYSNHYGETITETIVEAVITKPKDNDITITNAPNKEQWYYVDHHTAGIRLEFKKGKFNTHQNVWQLHGKGKADALECATALREIADWLQAYFPELVSEPKRERHIPRQEGAKPGHETPHSKKGIVPCYYSLKPEVAEFIKNESKANGMTQGEFIEWMMTEDDE